MIPHKDLPKEITTSTEIKFDPSKPFNLVYGPKVRFEQGGRKFDRNGNLVRETLHLPKKDKQ